MTIWAMEVKLWESYFETSMVLCAKFQSNLRWSLGTIDHFTWNDPGGPAPGVTEIFSPFQTQWISFEFVHETPLRKLSKPPLMGMWRTLLELN